MVIDPCCKCHKFHLGVQCEQDRRTNFAGYDHNTEIADLRRQLDEWQSIAKDHAASSAAATSQCIVYQGQLAEVEAERDRLFKLAYPDGPEGDAGVSAKRFMAVEAERNRLLEQIKNGKYQVEYECGCLAGGDNISSYCPVHHKAALRREEL